MFGSFQVQSKVMSLFFLESTPCIEVGRVRMVKRKCICELTDSLSPVVPFLLLQTAQSPVFPATLKSALAFLPLYRGRRGRWFFSPARRAGD